MMDAVDLLGRRLAGAIMVGGALIGVGIYMSGDEYEAQTYQAFTADGEVFRLNTDSGTIIACNAKRCTRILERGQDLEEDQNNTLFTAPPQLPAPQPAPQAQQPQQAPAQQGPAQAPAAPAR